MNDFYSYLYNKIIDDEINVSTYITDKMRRVCDNLEKMYEFNVVRGVGVTHVDNKITLHIFGCAFDIVREIANFIKALDFVDGFYIYNDRESEEFSLSFEFNL